MRFGIVLALLVLVAGLFLFGLRRDPSLLPSVLAEKRKPAPDFTLPILPPTAKLGEKRSGFPGSSAGLSSLTSGPAGAPCRREAPMLEAYWRRYQDQVLFIGVNFQDTEEAALAFIREFGLSFPSVADPRGRVGIDYGVYGLPETFFIDPEGRVQARHVGELKPKDLEGYLRTLLP